MLARIGDRLEFGPAVQAGLDGDGQVVGVDGRDEDVVGSLTQRRLETHRVEHFGDDDHDRRSGPSVGSNQPQELLGRQRIGVRHDDDRSGVPAGQPLHEILDRSLDRCRQPATPEWLGETLGVRAEDAERARLTMAGDLLPQFGDDLDRMQGPGQDRGHEVDDLGPVGDLVVGDQEEHRLGRVDFADAPEEGFRPVHVGVVEDDQQGGHVADLAGHALDVVGDPETLGRRHPQEFVDGLGHGPDDGDPVAGVGEIPEFGDGVDHRQADVIEQVRQRDGVTDPEFALLEQGRHLSGQFGRRAQPEQAELGCDEFGDADRLDDLGWLERSVEQARDHPLDAAQPPFEPGLQAAPDEVGQVRVARSGIPGLWPSSPDGLRDHIGRDALDQGLRGVGGLWHGGVPTGSRPGLCVGTRHRCPSAAIDRL